jgi:hypothetical protein
VDSLREKFLRPERQHRERFLAELEPGEQLLAYGKRRNGYIAVTPQRLITNVWPTGLLWSLPFDRVTGVEQEIFETHRYRLRLSHERIDLPPELKPDPSHFVRRVSRFRRRRIDTVRTILEFSRAETKAAAAVRQELMRRSIPLPPPTVLPHLRHRMGRGGPQHLTRQGPFRAWWTRRFLRRVERQERASSAGSIH